MTNAITQEDFVRAWGGPAGGKEFIKVAGFGHYTKVVGDFITPRDGQWNRFLFRGVPDCKHDLLPSIARLPRDHRWIDAKELHKIETDATNHFARNAHLVVDPQFLPSDATLPGHGISLLWWQMMQHHGATTRLLDWTASQYVALYFAVADDLDKDGAVWMVDPGMLDGLMDQRYPKMLKHKRALFIADVNDSRRDYVDGCVLFAPPTLPNERMVAQSGWFSYACRPETDHGLAIADAVLSAGKAGEWTQKIVIPKEEKRAILRDLWYMNITHATLFPGLDGLAQMLKRRVDFMRIPERENRFTNGLLTSRKLPKV